MVSFELADAYSDEIRQAISSGLRTTFTYDIELRMVVPGWVDRTIATATVSTSDQYDNLTRRHSADAAGRRPRRTTRVVSEDDAAVKTVADDADAGCRCAIPAKLDPARDYYVRISARAKPRGASIIGWANAVTGQAKFTFIP